MIEKSGHCKPQSQKKLLERNDIFTGKEEWAKGEEEMERRKRRKGTGTESRGGAGLPRAIIEWKPAGLGTSSRSTLPIGRDFLMPTAK